MPINGIETAYKDRYTFAPLSQRADSVVHFASAIYTVRRLTYDSHLPSCEVCQSTDAAEAVRRINEMFEI